MLNITKVESLIKEHGWTNTYFCSKLGHSRVWITDMKHGKGLPDENMIHTIADQLDTTVEYLTDQSDIKNKPAAQGDGQNQEDKEFMEKIKLLSPENRKTIEKNIAFLLAGQSDKE